MPLRHDNYHHLCHDGHSVMCIEQARIGGGVCYTHGHCIYNVSAVWLHIYNDRPLDRTNDTVYIRELSTEYRYKLLRDTLRIIESDTIYIPYGVKVADNGKDKSFLPRFSELAKAAFLVVTAALALWVALRNKAWWCSSGVTLWPMLCPRADCLGNANYRECPWIDVNWSIYRQLNNRINQIPILSDSNIILRTFGQSN